MLKRAPGYHAHIYFLPEELDRADALRVQAFADLEGLATVWPVRRVPVGPHVRPMFEIEFPHASREAVLAWVEAHRGAQPVLLHPESGNELADHRDHAVWLGEELPLNLSVLR